MTQPVPDNVRKLRGNPGKRKPPQRPKAVVAQPSKPADLRGEAAAEWKRVSVELERMRLLARIDRGTLLFYCATYGMWFDTWRQIQADSLVALDERKLPRKHPLWQVYRDAGASMLGAAKELGLTPASRGRMVVATDEDADGGSILDS